MNAESGSTIPGRGNGNCIEENLLGGLAMPPCHAVIVLSARARKNLARKLARKQRSASEIGDSCKGIMSIKPPGE